MTCDVSPVAMFSALGGCDIRVSKECVLSNSWSQHICWPGVKIHMKHENESDPRQSSSIFCVVLGFQASVLDEESLDSKVLVKNKY